MQHNGKVYKLLRCIAVLTALFGGLMLGGCDQSTQSQLPPTIPEVATVAVKPQRVSLTTKLPGRTAAFRIAEIRPQASGIIQKRLFTEGAEVKAGDVLYEIDPSSYQAAYANAEAAMAVAKANHINALATVAAAKAGHATALATCDAAKASLFAAKAALSRAEANAVPLRLRTERFRELVAEKAVSQQDFDDTLSALKQAEAGIENAVAAVRGAEAEILRAEAAIQVANADIKSTEAAVQSTLAAIGSAEAGLETARINLGYTRITAPISGRIGKSGVTDGALVGAYQPVPLATIQQLDPIYVDVAQSTNELLRLQRRMEDGQLNTDGGKQNKVDLVLEDGTAYPMEGTLKFRDVTVDKTTGSVILRAVFPNPEGILLPGMFVRAVVKEGVSEQAILVPQQSVSRNPKGDPFVLIVDNEEKVHQRMITIDREVGNRWLVSSGLDIGDRVIVEGKQRVRTGASVNSVAFDAGQGDSPAAQNNDESSSPKN
jgi:membrane fusion protein (multidrug efflux system)